jgi:NADPH2:quinone reductase
MRAMRAEEFTGYEGLKLVDLVKPAVTDGKVLVRITAAGVTPLDRTSLSGEFHGVKAPLVLGNEGAGVVEQGGAAAYPVGSRVMFFGAYGVFEDGTYSEWVAVQKEDLCLIPENVDDVTAAGIPVAYLTAQVALARAGFREGKTVLARVPWVQNTPCQARPIMRKPSRRRRSDSRRSSIPPRRSWVTACVASPAVTAQTLSSTESAATS